MMMIACSPPTARGRPRLRGAGAFTCSLLTLFLILLVRQGGDGGFGKRRLAVAVLGRALFACAAVVVAAIGGLPAVIGSALLVLHLVDHRTDHFRPAATEDFLAHGDGVLIDLGV